MATLRPQWVSKERKTVNSLWRVGGGSAQQQQDRAASLEDFDVKPRGSLLSEAEQDTDRNYETSPSDTTYVPNVDVKTVEIVKRNGCYTLQEDGRVRRPTALTRDENILSEGSLDFFGALRNDGGFENKGQFELRMAAEARKGGNEAQANYTIGDARVRDVNHVTAAPFVSPVAFRVRLEDGELPPTRCVLSVRSVIVQGFDTASRLQSVADYSVHEIGDIPMASVSDPTTGALLLPYPASVTTPLHTTLISKRRVRDAMDAARKASYVRPEILLPPLPTTATEEQKAERVTLQAAKKAAEAAAEAEAAAYKASLRGRVLAAVFPRTDPLVWAFGTLYGAVRSAVKTVAGFAMSATIRILAYLHTKRRFRDAMSNTSYDYFTYGRASMSVFADLASDIHAICDYVEEGNTTPTLGDRAINALTTFLRRRVPEGETRPLYNTLSPRERELAEFFSGAEKNRDQQLLKTPSNRPGTVLAYARSKDELNEADPSFLRKEAQLHYRVDTYFDVEIWDPQFSDIIRISVAPGLQAGLEAGRLMQTMGGKLKDDFYTLVAAQDRLIGLRGTKGMSDIVPEAVYTTAEVDSDDGTLIEIIAKETTKGQGLKDLQQFKVGRRLRELLGLPPKQEDGRLAWKIAEDPNEKTRLQLLIEQDIGRGDFEYLPFFAHNRALVAFGKDYTESNRMQYAFEVTDDSVFEAQRRSFTTLENGLLLRTLSQLVIPEYRSYGTRVDSATTLELSSSVSNDFHLKQTFAAGMRVQKELNNQLRTFSLEERSAGAASGTQNTRLRMRFATLYTVLPQDVDSVISKLGEVYTSSIRTTLPFSSMYPDAVAAQMAASFVSDLSQNKAMELVTGEEENTVQIARAEATEAFSSILVDTLGATNVFQLSTKDLSQSVVTTSKRRLRAAALLIKRIFVQSKGAVVNWDDDLMWLMPDSVYALIALNHSSCWQYRWDRASIVQGRAVWTSQLNMFATELLKLSRSSTHPVKLLPLLNVQSTWVSARTSAPSDSEAVRASVKQTLKAFLRVTSIAKAIGGMSVDGPFASDLKTAFALCSLSYAVEDVVLSHPIVWRMSQTQLTSILDDIKTHELREDPSVEQGVRSITHEELKHAWARRRIDVADDLQRMAVPVDISFLSDKLGACDLDTDQDEECVYYVPACCDSLPNMADPYDAKLAMQLLFSSRINDVASKMTSVDNLAFASTGTVVTGADMVIAIQSPLKNKRPTNPLLIHTNVMKGNTGAVVSVDTPAIRVFMTPQVDAVYNGLLVGHTRPFTELNTNSLQYLYARDIPSLLVAMSIDNRPEASFAMLHNARRTVVFAIDRLYQALLYARLLKPAGTMKIAIDLKDMPLSVPMDSGCSDTSLWPVNAPKHVDNFNRDPVFAQMTQNESQKSNRDMTSLALLLALSLLPKDLSDGLSFTVLSPDTPANESAAQLLSTVVSATRTAGFVHVPLGELVACIVHRCL